MTGGTLLASGSSGMAQAPTAGQAVLSISFDGSVASATPVQLATASGEVLADYTSAKSYSSLVFTSTDLTAGAEYTIVLAGDQVGTVAAT